MLIRDCLDITFDCLQHDIIIAKLNAYGFDMKALNKERK